MSAITKRVDASTVGPIALNSGPTLPPEKTISVAPTEFAYGKVYRLTQYLSHTGSSNASANVRVVWNQQQLMVETVTLIGGLNKGDKITLLMMFLDPSVLDRNFHGVAAAVSLEFQAPSNVNAIHVVGDPPQAVIPGSSPAPIYLSIEGLALSDMEITWKSTVWEQIDSA